MPLVSVIMPAYNASKTIESAINSVLKQTVGDFELIIIDDCSKDDTVEKISALAQSDERIVVLLNEKNSGVAHSRNYGVSVAKGEWVAFLDSDDMWREDKLEKQLELVNTNPQAAITYTASSFMDWEGKPYSYIMPVNTTVDYKTLLRRNLLSCSSVMVKKNIIERYKMPSDNMSEDYAVWLMVLKEVGFAYGVNEPLLIYRLSKNSKSSSRIKAFRMHFNAYRYVGYNVVYSLFLTALYTFYSVAKRKNIKEG